MVGSTVSARPERSLSMRIVLILVAVIVIAASIYADFRWRKWVEARRRERDQ
jgi:hypothetical protein